MAKVFVKLRFLRRSTLLLIPLLVLLQNVQVRAQEQNAKNSDEEELKLTNAKRTLTCKQCDHRIPDHLECPYNLEHTDVDKEEFTSGYKTADRCFACFIEHVWQNGTFKGEMRGCLTTTPFETGPGHCTYHYPSLELGHKEAREVCRCKDGNDCNNSTMIALGGTGDITRFPTTTPLVYLKDGGGRLARMEGVGWGGILLIVVYFINHNYL